jgi:ferredoxin
MGQMLSDYEVYLVQVDSERCDSCGECVKMCPTEPRSISSTTPPASGA